MSSAANCEKTKHRDTGIWPQKLCFLCCIIIVMVQNGVCTNFCLFMTQEYKVMRINEKVAQTLRCSNFKSGATKH